ncbi:MAG: glycosyltransferase [Gemmatimonas sp.]
MSVSIIIPAFNAVATVAIALESVLAQSRSDWEAVVVDDGSTDETAAVVTMFAQRDARIRLVRQSNAGEGGARNAGVAIARFDWLAFLDADDWLLPGFLARLLDARDADPSLDAVHCGWRYVDPDGQATFDKHCANDVFLFPVFARYCGFAVNACIVRRRLVEDVGAFATDLRTCADWDLWQRIARAGARFGRVEDVLAQCRMRPHQASLDVEALLSDGLRVIARGHTTDERVARPHPEYAGGAARDDLEAAGIEYLCGVAAVCIGAGGDARTLLGSRVEQQALELDRVALAYMFFEKVPFAVSRAPAAWPDLWRTADPQLLAFLVALEAHLGDPGLARRVRRLLLLLIVDWTETFEPPAPSIAPSAEDPAWGNIAALRADAIAELRQERTELASALENAIARAASVASELQSRERAAAEAIAALQAERAADHLALANLHQQYRSTLAENEQLLERGASADRLVVSLREELERAWSERAQVAESLARALSDADALRASRSWRITAPLRTVFDRLSNLRP